jgi:hypothetical protein
MWRSCFFDSFNNMFSLCNSSTFLTIFLLIFSLPSSFFFGLLRVLYSLDFFHARKIRNRFLMLNSFYLSFTYTIGWLRFIPLLLWMWQCFDLLLYSIVICRNGKQERSPIWQAVSLNKNCLSSTKNLLHLYRCDVLVSLILFFTSFRLS